MIDAKKTMLEVILIHCAFHFISDCRGLMKKLQHLFNSLLNVNVRTVCFRLELKKEVWSLTAAKAKCFLSVSQERQIPENCFTSRMVIHCTKKLKNLIYDLIFSATGRRHEPRNKSVFFHHGFTCLEVNVFLV